MTLLELKEALKNATGPDRKLDFEIEKVCKGMTAVHLPYTRRYTLYVDAIASIMPKGWNVYLAFRIEGDGEVHMHQWKPPCQRIPEHGIIRGSTPALALCGALIQYKIIERGA